MNSIYRRVRIFVKSVLILLSIYIAVLATHTIWLGWVAGFLILDQEFDRADLLVVSTGSYERFRCAVDLMKEGRANRLLLLGDPRIKTPVPGKSVLDLAWEEALGLGLSPDKVIAKESTSTLVDARVTAKVLRDSGYRSAGVVSDVYNMRRLAMIFDRTLGRQGYNMVYLSAKGKWARFHPDRWWRYPYEFEYVLKEWIKMPLDYYRLEFLAK